MLLSKTLRFRLKNWGRETSALTRRSGGVRWAGRPSAQVEDDREVAQTTHSSSEGL